jgi:hypothetical protein
MLGCCLVSDEAAEELTCLRLQVFVAMENLSFIEVGLSHFFLGSLLPRVYLDLADNCIFKWLEEHLGHTQWLCDIG